MGWLVSLSPWVQVPLILAAALPVGGIVAWIVVKVTDAVAGAVGKQGGDARGDSRR